MKKISLLIFWLILSTFLNAQEVLIPYKKGNQFGLINQNGKTIVAPQYDGLNWLTGKYFISTVKNQNLNLHGLLYKDKEIIKPQPSLMYRVIPEMMILGVLKDIQKPEDSNALRYELYSANGQKIKAAEFSRLELIGTTGKSQINPDQPAQAVLYAEDFQHRPGVFVFDGDNQRIKEWLFKDVTDFKVLNKSKIGDIYYMSYTDSLKKSQRKILKITSENYSFEDLIGEVPEQQIVGTNKNAEIKGKESITPKHKKKSLYKDENGKLIFQNDEETREIEPPKEVEPIFKYNKLKNQTGNLIYKKENKFGWIQDGMLTPAEFDSLAYFGNDQYLVCNKQHSKFSCGTFDLNLKTVLPIEYDSILGAMNRFVFIPKQGTSDFELKMTSGVRKSKPDEVSYILPVFGVIAAYKDGKVTILKTDGTKVFDTEFDEIGSNGLSLPGEVKTEFTVLKKDGLYGLLFSIYDSESGKNLQQIIEPIFKYYPAFYIKDYYEQPGYILFGLYDENGHFETYASDFGVMYAD